MIRIYRYVTASHIFNIPFTRMERRWEGRGGWIIAGGGNFHFQLRYSERFNNFTGGPWNIEEIRRSRRSPPVSVSMLNSVKLITRDIWSKLELARCCPPCLLPPKTRKQGFSVQGEREMEGGSWETGVQVVAATPLPLPRSLARLYYGRVAASN